MAVKRRHYRRACPVYLASNSSNNILIVPFFKQVALPLGVVGFVVLTYLTIVGTSNAVNLTDGLDGLAAFPVVLVAAGLAIFAYASGHSQFAQYLQLPYVAGANEVVIFCTAMCGACLGFLWFNAYPAQVFMGDVGVAGIGRGTRYRCRHRPPRVRPRHHGRPVRR